jgi:hypothetical protein
VGWRGKVQLKCGEMVGVANLVAVGRAPFKRARPYCLLDWQGAQASLGGLVVFSSSLIQLRVDEK